MTATDPGSALETSAEVIDTVDDLVRITARWRSALGGGPPPTPNADPDLYDAARTHVGAAPCIVFGDTGALIVARRLERRLHARIGYLRVPGPVMDCIDIVHGGVHGPAPEAASIIGGLAARANADVVTINHLDEDRGRALLPPGAIPVGMPAPHWRFHYAAGSWDRSWQRFSKKHRYNLRRSERMLASHAGHDPGVQCATDAASVDDFVGHAQRIAARSWQESTGAGLRAGSAIVDVMRRAAELGRWRGMLLHAGAAPIAYQCGILQGSRYHLIATAFDPEFARFSPGQMLHVRSMARLRAEGACEIDYGFGDAPYKQIYGTSCTLDRSWLVPAATPRGAVAALWTRSVEVARRHALRSRRVTDHVRRAWRRRLTPSERRAA